MKRIAVLSILAGALVFAAPAYASSRGDTGSGAVGVPVHSNDPTAGARDCTEADKRDGTGLERQGDNAVVSFTLTRDCVASMWSYAQNGPGHPPVDSDVARGVGRHTLSVRACSQVDAVWGATHEQNGHDAFKVAHYEESCEVPPSTTSTGPPTTTSTTASPTTTTSSPDTPTTTPVSCVPECENPDAPEHPPAQLAVGGAPEGALPMALFGLAAILLGGAPLVWQGGKG